mgnify:CR=1 FL=1
MRQWYGIDFTIGRQINRDVPAVEDQPVPAGVGSTVGLAVEAIVDAITFVVETLLDAIAGFSFLAHFDGISKGVINVEDLVYFLSLIAFWLFANVVIVETKKAD